jgi:protein-tyrosine phosphatase
LISKVSIITDFHSHLLPDIDCSAPPSVSAKLLKAIAEKGVQNIVLTPHFYPQANNNVEDFIEERDEKIKALRSEMEAEGSTSINIIPAAEVLLCQGLEKLENLHKLCVENTNTILIEMPDLPWSDALLRSLTSIRDDLGLNVIVAHIDRYGKKEVARLIAKGFKAQVNADSTISLGMRRTILDWAKSGYVYALGSDKHVHSDKKALIYKDFPKAAGILSKYADIINERSLKLIGK